MSELDPLDAFMRDAATAARDRAADGADDGAVTRMRIRESLSRAPSPRRRFTLIAAVIATMFGSTAFAYVAAVKAGWVESPFHHDDPVPIVAPAPPPDKFATPSQHAALPDVPSADVIGSTTIEAPTPTVVDASLGIAATDQSAPVEVPAPVVVATAPVVLAKTPVAKPTHVDRAPRPDLIRAPRRAITAEVPSPPVSSTTAPPPEQVTQPAQPVEVGPSAELAAYRHAHELHFRGSDPKAALTAWDEYLTTYPNGALAPDARYDRAILLVKLGRYKDARVALTPFASAAPGSYKQKEAAEIVDAIKDR